MDKEMQRALMLDAEKLGHLTGEDHTPEFLADCEECDGAGYILRTIYVYEPGCGISHPDVEQAAAHVREHGADAPVEKSFAETVVHFR